MRAREAARASASATALLICIACEGGSSAGGNPATGGARATGGAGTSGAAAGNGGVGAGAAGAGGANALAPWQAEDLGEGQCLAINAQGQVLGLDAEGTFLIEADRTRTALGAMPDGARAIGAALGPNGEVVGFAESDAGRTAIRHTAGGWEVLEGVAGTWSVAASIDERGQIVGTQGTSDGTVQAFIWEKGISEPVVPSSVSSSALIRANGRVAGVMQVDELTHAFVALDDGKVTDLGTLGGNGSNPFAMSGSGTIVGASHDDSGRVSAFSWKPGGSLRALGVPDGARASEARGLDSGGHVLGNVIDDAGIAHGVFFDTEKDIVFDLPVPAAVEGASFVAARVVAMAPDGRAVGSGAVRGGTGNPIHCVLWSPL